MPLGDFFACGWGKYCQINSLPVCVNPGSAFNCYWTMPFRKKAKITMENLDDKDMTLYYQINYTLTDVPDDAAYFHAQFRRVHKLPAKSVYTILDGVQGRGQYVGTYLAWEVRSPGWWGEGEIKFFLDGDKEFPTICGTGTEDYFCGSYNFENRETQRYQTFSTPYTGLAQVLPPDIDLRARPAVRPVPLAHRRPGPLREGPEGDDPGPGLAVGRALPAAGGRHRLGGLLVSDRAAPGVPGAAQQGGAGDQADLGGAAEAGREEGKVVAAAAELRGLGSGPFFGDRALFSVKLLPENMDLTPSCTTTAWGKIGSAGAVSPGRAAPTFRAASASGRTSDSPR